MPRKKKDETTTPLSSLPLADMFVESCQPPFYCHRATVDPGTGMEIFVLVALGESAKSWQEVAKSSDEMCRVSLPENNGQQPEG